MAEDDRMTELEERLRRLEVRETAMERSRRAMDIAVPHQTRQHLRNAGRENLMAFRTLLDHWIDRLGDGSDGRQALAGDHPDRLRGLHADDR